MAEHKRVPNLQELDEKEAYTPECVEGLFSEVGLPLYGVLRRSGTKNPLGETGR